MLRGFWVTTWVTLGCIQVAQRGRGCTQVPVAACSRPIPCLSLPAHMHGPAIPFHPPAGSNGVSPRSDGGYLGCYKDDIPRTMSALGESGDMTVEKCRDIALDAGYTIFSVQYASQCFGSSDFFAATRLGLSDNCNMGCAGAAYQDCGGGWAHTMYLVAAGGGRVHGEA